MKNPLSNRVQAVKPSPTLTISARAGQLRAEGKDILGLGVGEPDFNTPRHIKDAAIDAINNNQTRYTAVDGTAELKQAIIDKFKRDNQFDYEADQILVSSGGKQSFYNLAQALLNPQDEVIIPAPYWVSYPDMVLLADAVPVLIHANAEQSFKITAQQLEQAITDKTKLFVINSPSNPTGMSYTLSELRDLADILLKYPDIYIATDDMYEHIRWDDTPFVNILTAAPELKSRILVLNGVSKAYCMTGWRIGYAGGPVEIIKAMKKIQSQSTSNPASPSQAAAVAALNGDQTFITKMNEAFKERHDDAVERLNQIDGFHCLPTDGTFYLFPSIKGAIDKLDHIHNDLDFAEYLINEAGVAAVPGSAFGLEDHLRLSIAVSMETLQDAINRIAKAVAFLYKKR